MLARMKNNIGIMYKVIASIAIILVLFLINVDHIFYGEGAIKIIKTFLYCIIGIAILCIINKFIINKLNNKNKLILTIIGLIIFLILEILSYIYFRVEYNWDFKWIMDSALERAQTGNVEALYYFRRFPNNAAALMIVTFAMKLFNNNVIGAYVINIMFIFASAIFTVLVARKIGGEKLGLNAILLLIGFMPIYLYAPIVYTDTLSIPFPIAILYFWILAKEQKDKSTVKYYIYIVIMTITAVLAYFVKANSIIIWIAIIIETIFNGKKIWKPLLVSILTFLLLMGISNDYINNNIIKSDRKNNDEFPITHWVMLGLGLPTSEGGTAINYGAYSQDDADYSAIQPTFQDKKNANIARIKERLKNFGVKGYLTFLAKKFDFIWNDGTYYVLHKIGWDTINKDTFFYRLIIGDWNYKFAIPYMRYFNDIIFIMMLYIVVKKIIKKDMDEVTRVIGISIVGIVLFLLIWEARSRYVYLILPLLCILAAKGIEDLSNKNVKMLIDKADAK